MNAGEMITRGTVWLALICYTATVVLQTSVSARAQRAGRILWAIGCVVFLAHVAAAFQFYHQWSHLIAAEDTRRQTMERVGMNFSAGIYFNYLFAAVWLIDCATLVGSGKLLHEGRRTWRIILHSFFLSMIFNATVVFGHGWARPTGAILCTLVVIALLWRERIPA